MFIVCEPFVKADGGMLFSYQNLGEKVFKKRLEAKKNVPPVSLLKDLELLAQEAAKCGSHNCP